MSVPTAAKGGHNWTDEQTDTLWSYVEKFPLQLYHGKGSLTRLQIIAKITALLSTYTIVSCLNCHNATPSMHSWSLHFFADTHLDISVTKKQVDDKIYHIERRFKAREEARHSGAADQSVWPLEERVIPVCGERRSNWVWKWHNKKTQWDTNSALYHRGTPIHQTRHDLQFWTYQRGWQFSSSITRCRHSVKHQKVDIATESIW